MLVSELIITQASDEAIHALRPYQARLEEAVQAEDRDAYFWGNLSFRATEAEICGNVQVQRVLDSLGLRTLQLRYRSLASPGRMEQSANDHARLLRAYEERDAPLAIAMTRSLVLGGLAAVEHSGWLREDMEQNARME
jgi:DNA-binding GntR family transcriptional regulator